MYRPYTLYLWSESLSNSSYMHVVVAYSYSWSDLAREYFGDAKIADLEHGSLSIHEHILRLEITVEDVERMDVFNGHQQLNKQLQNTLCWHVQ